MATKVMMSMAEFDELIEPDEMNQELDEGVLVEMPKPRAKHNRIATKLLIKLCIYLDKHPIGEAFNPDQMYILGPDTKRAPDVSVVLKPRVVASDHDLEGAPDIAVEVMSPNDSRPAVQRKLKQFFGAGCQTAVVIYPESQEVEIWNSTGIQATLSPSDALTFHLLPGFSLPVAALFEN